MWCGISGIGHLRDCSVFCVDSMLSLLGRTELLISAIRPTAISRDAIEFKRPNEDLLGCRRFAGVTDETALETAFARPSQWLHSGPFVGHTTD